MSCPELSRDLVPLDTLMVRRRGTVVHTVKGWFRTYFVVKMDDGKFREVPITSCCEDPIVERKEDECCTAER